MTEWRGKALLPILRNPILPHISKATMSKEWKNGLATTASSRDEGSHYGGGTINVAIPKEWFDLSYDEFLERVITLAAAKHYGFTPNDLKEKKGLKEFFGFKRVCPISANPELAGNCF